MKLFDVIVEMLISSSIFFILFSRIWNVILNVEHMVYELG